VHLNSILAVVVLTLLGDACGSWAEDAVWVPGTAKLLDGREFGWCAYER